MEIGYNGESFDDFSQKNSLAKLSKGSDAKPKGLRQYAMSAGCNKKMRIG